MYNCKNCLTKYTYEQVLSNKVNTYEPINGQNNTFQCNKCFSLDGLVYELGEDCPICCDNKTNFIFTKCGHTICGECRTDGENECFVCGTTDNTLVKAKFINNEYFFDNVNAIIKACFKKLYCQIIDKFDKKMGSNGRLYKLCVEYYKFLQLLHINDNNNNKLKLSPSKLIDSVWHAHLLDNENYNKVCNLTCGYILYHYPENGFVANIVNYGERFNKTIELYEKNFGSDMDKVIWAPSHECTQPDDIINITIKSLTGECIQLAVAANIDIEKLKDLITKSEGIMGCQQRLIFNGRQLSDEGCLSDHNIKNGSVIQLVLRMTGC